MARRKIHPLILIPGSALAVVILILAALLFAVRSQVFKNEIRSRIISNLAAATGGRVTLQSFHFEWRTLTAQATNLVIHGSEPAGSPALLQVPSVRVRLKATSLLKRTFDIVQIAIDRPQVYVLIRPDGSSNLPKPHLDAQSTIDQLLEIRINRLDLAQGSLLLNERRYPMDLHTRDLVATLTYDAPGLAYRVHLASDNLALNAMCCENLPLRFDVRAELRKDRLNVRSLKVTSAGSGLQAEGTLRNFNHPSGDFHFNSELMPHEVSAALHLPALHEGTFSLTGTATFHSETDISVDGMLRAQHLSYRLPSLTVSSLDVTSGFHATGVSIALHDIVAHGLGGTFLGSADLSKSRKLQLTGRVVGVSLSRVAAAYGRSLPFSGNATGPLSLTAELTSSSPSNLSVRGNLDIVPANRGVPISGKLEFAGGPSTLEFGDSHLSLPNSQIAFKGSAASGFTTRFDTTRSADFVPVLQFLDPGNGLGGRLPSFLPGGSAHFDGRLRDPSKHLSVDGALTLVKFESEGQKWDSLRLQGFLTVDHLDVHSIRIDGDALHASGDGHIQLRDWKVASDSGFSFRGEYRNIDMRLLGTRLPALVSYMEQGIASGTADLSGTWQRPTGIMYFKVQNPSFHKDQFQQLEADVSLTGEGLRVKRGTLTSLGGGSLSFSGDYLHVPGDWRSGLMALALKSSALSLSRSNFVRDIVPDLHGTAEINAQITVRFARGVIEPIAAKGRLALKRLVANGSELGSVSANVVTRQQQLDCSVQGDLRNITFEGTAQVGLTAGSVVRGTIAFKRLSLATLDALLRPSPKRELAAGGSLQGSIHFEGPLIHPTLWRSSARIDQLAITSILPLNLTENHVNAFDLHNQEPILLDLSAGTATIRSFHLAGSETSITVSGSVGYLDSHPLHLALDGSVDLQLLRLFDPNLQSSGRSVLKAAVSGTLRAPTLDGRLELHGASFSLNDFQTGLSNVNGAVRFTSDRATIENLTAASGGGLLKVGGFVSFTGTGPFVYHLDARAEGVRVRYGSISVTATTDLRLTGTSTSSLLSGAATISRVVFNSNTDVGNVLTNLAAPVPTAANRKDFLTGMHLDVTIESTPDLELATALSRDVEAGIDLRLRGTPDHPSLLGSVSANQGDIRAFGTRYSINRGEISFANPSKIDPLLDLDLRTQVRGIAVNITISGTLNRLNIAYSSDPPLQPRDIIALLTVGRTPQEASNVQTTQTSTETTALPNSVNSVLGQAINPSSGRLSKLFGVTNIKLDPLVQGIASNTQSRLTLEQQISRAITVTYITNLEQTSEQIFRVEWALDQQYSVVAVRDDNGEFGIDIQYKRRF
jgi:translocation and assembly module TamB